MAIITFSREVKKHNRGDFRSMRERIIFADAASTWNAVPVMVKRGSATE